MSELKRFREVVNLTPHAIHLYENRYDIDPNVDKPLATFEPSGVVARVQAKTISMGNILIGKLRVGETITIHQEVNNVPNPREGVLYLVSYLVADSLKGRADIFCGANFVYNDRRQKVGMRTFGKIS